MFAAMLLFDFLRYKWLARNLHGTHSPFVYALLEQVVYDRRMFYAYQEVEEYRQVLTIKGQKGDISSPYGQLIFRLVKHFKPTGIHYIGETLGLTSAYMRKAKPSASIEIVPASNTSPESVQQHWKKMTLAADQAIFQATTQPSKSASFCLINGQFSPSNVSAFDQEQLQCLVLTNIHTSSKAKQLWQEICKENSFTATLDLWGLGIAFKNPKQAKEHFTLKY